METLAILVGGLGLFLIGIREIGANLQQAAGRRTRAVVARATGGPVAASLAGVLLGALTQSTNAATVVATSMLAAGLLSFRRAMAVVAWSNVGTAALVLLATVDLRLAVLWLLGLVGVATHFGVGRGGRLRPSLGALLGLGLLFLGLTLMKAGAAPVRDLPLAQEMLALVGGALVPPFLAGVALTLVAQSSSTVTILAIALGSDGLVSSDQATMVVYGASLGSGLAVMLFSGNLSGTARQIALYQLLFKAIGTALFLLLFVVERVAGVPLVLALAEAAGGEELHHRLAWLFLFFQLGTVLAVAPVSRPLRVLLARLSPPREAEALARPQFLYEQALEDPATALALVDREQARLLARLPTLLDPLREDGLPPAAPRAELLAGSAAVERAVTGFLADLIARGSSRTTLEHAVLLEGRVELIAALRVVAGEFVATAEGPLAAAPDSAVAGVLRTMTEALHLLLGQLSETAVSGDKQDAALLRKLTADRGEMMHGLRRRVSRADPGVDYDAQDALFRGTTLFERAVWLTGRVALLLEPGSTGEASAEAEAQA